MFEKIKVKAATSNRYYWLVFMLKTLVYLLIMVGLVYLYKYLHVEGGNFIYNEF